MPAVPLPLIPAGSREQTVAGEAEGAVVRRSVLPGGVRVLTEAMPGLRSATFGCWVGVGSRDEATGHHGSTHFLEHLLFKGTARRSAMDIASAFDAVGGEANAVTGKEHTCYYARVLDEDVDLAADVLLDMVTAARLDASDVESERGVILEELAMNDDDPVDVVHERFAELVLRDHPLGRPIGGTAETIGAVGRDDIAAHYREHYVAPGLVVTAAGGVDHDRLVDAVRAHLATSPWPADDGAAPLPRRDRPVPPGPGEPGVLVVRRPTEQANVVVGTLGLTADDERRYVMSVLNAVLGGGMSSRLFQEIREKRGLAYSVYSFASGYSDAGWFGLYAGCAPGKVDQVVTLLHAGLEELAEHGVADDELARAKGSVTGGLVLGMEDSGSRMTRLGRAELVHGEFVGLDETLARLRAVDADDVRALATELAGRPRSLAVVGPFDPDRSFARTA
ncbi:MAG TPA: pitrilysin family protein [Kineosporiaceae bacterium]|nr:pitrilysin family protein [Kineosporiaceae bacterium]